MGRFTTLVAADERAAELTGDLQGADRGAGSMLRRVGSAVWRLGRALHSVGQV